MCVYECFLNAKLMKNFYFQEMRGNFYLSFIKIGSQPTSASMFCKLKMMFEIIGHVLSINLKHRKNPKEDDEQDGTNPSECRHQAL